MKLKKLILTMLIFLATIFIGNKVQALTITIDPGHGGTIPAGITGESAGTEYNGLVEKDMTLKIAKYLRDYLNNYKDVEVVLTRETDTFMRLFNRAIVARDNNSDLLLSIHINDLSETDFTTKGAEAYVTANTSLPKYNEGTTKLSEIILNNLSKLGFNNRGVRTRLLSGNDQSDKYSDGTLADYYGIIRYGMRGTMIDNGDVSIYKNSTDIDKTILAKANTPEDIYSANIQNGEGVPTILLEHGYIRGDYDLLNTDEKLKQIAEADGKAIVEYYGLKLKKELANTPFTDVYADDWYASAVEYTYNKGILLGTSETTFNPNTQLTRGMLVTILHRMNGKPTPTIQNPFNDVDKSQYYYDAVLWAAENGIIHGYDDGSGNFGPDDKITRQDIAVIIRNYTEFKGINTNYTTSLSSFSDANSVSDYAKSAVQWAVRTGVITGNDEENGKTLTPHRNATRAEAASIMLKYYKNVLNK